ncbi:MAG: gamma-glutamyl-gamma-aminobutyrate hydrolase family protein [Alphaproteobacteria bacterium]|nr:gamma-glutamyl-gamma-aminobutyrate hydrolase family protein [Alphaproteobacteria bacterium]
MSTPPLIGVSACVITQRHEYHAAADQYVRAVSVGAGGIPVILPSLGDALEIDALIARLDGLMLTGSPSNVEPGRYGGPAPRPDTLLDRRRDSTTLPLVTGALEAGLPVLAICRGHQELNVALGGTLHQHVHELPGRADHRAPADKPMAERYAPIHDVTLTASGQLAALVDGASRARVNSLHSQAIDRLAPGLAIEAVAPDGTIEAVRVTGARRFAIGVQWHPEWMIATDALARSLFHGFGEAARDRARRRVAA